MTIIDLTLGERLRIFRERAGLAVGDVADMLEVSRATLSRWEHDQIIPKRLYLREMASKYGVELDLFTAAPKADADRRVGGISAGEEVLTDNNNTLEQANCRLDRDSYYWSTALFPCVTDAHSYPHKSQYRPRRAACPTFSVLTRKRATKCTVLYPKFTSASASTRRHSSHCLHTLPTCAQ